MVWVGAGVDSVDAAGAGEDSVVAAWDEEGCVAVGAEEVEDVVGDADSLDEVEGVADDSLEDAVDGVTEGEETGIDGVVDVETEDGSVGWESGTSVGGCDAVVDWDGVSVEGGDVVAVGVGTTDGVEDSVDKVWGTVKGEVDVVVATALSLETVGWIIAEFWFTVVEGTEFIFGKVLTLLTIGPAFISSLTTIFLFVNGKFKFISETVG